MRRCGYFLSVGLLAVSAPALALSPALSSALGNLLDVKLLAGLVFMAVLALWGPLFLKRVIAQQVAIEKSISGLDAENRAVFAEVEERRNEAVFEPQKPYLDDVSDEDFLAVMQDKGWSRITGDGFEGSGRTEPDRAGYGFSYEFSNRKNGLSAMVPSAPGQALGWGPEEFEAEEDRRAELGEMLNIEAMSDAAYLEPGGPFSLLELSVYDDEPDYLDNP